VNKAYSGADARRHPRAELAATAVVLTATRYVGTYLVRNLSAGGALFVGDALLAVGERIRILLRIAGLPPISLEAEIVRTEHREFGERFFAAVFRSVPAPVEDTLQRLVTRHLENQRESPSPVFVLDDSHEMCVALGRDLLTLGRQAVTATTPLDAITRLHAGQVSMDTVIVDARFGQADGIDFLSFLADDQPLVRRILMSSDFHSGQLDLAQASTRAHALLVKPWDQETLAVALAT